MPGLLCRLLYWLLYWLASWKPRLLLRWLPHWLPRWLPNWLPRWLPSSDSGESALMTSSISRCRLRRVSLGELVPLPEIIDEIHSCVSGSRPAPCICACQSASCEPVGSRVIFATPEAFKSTCSTLLEHSQLKETASKVRQMMQMAYSSLTSPSSTAG
eukprot:2745695-Pleurochrysis_carterae.AAC.2